MSPLSAEQILRVWERGAALPAAERVLAILAEMTPGVGASALARLPLGRRDRQLLDLRARTFGRQLRARVACPGCRATLDISFLADDLHSHTHSKQDSQASFCAGGFELAVRAPDSADLIAASACSDLDDARRLLARRCIVAARREGASVDVDAETIPDDLLPALATFLETIDPDADQRLEGQCPTCDARWESAFDIAGFLWMEIEVEAMRLLHDVHVIAHGYGWREVDILAMTPLRRRAYLELLS
jgi:hypothetical protein